MNYSDICAWTVCHMDSVEKPADMSGGVSRNQRVMSGESKVKLEAAPFCTLAGVGRYRLPNTSGKR